MGERPSFEEPQSDGQNTSEITLNLGDVFETRLLPQVEEHAQQRQRSGLLANLPPEYRTLLPNDQDE